MKKFFKYCSFVILTILFFSLYNSIEARNIEIHGTSWNKGVEFTTSIGAEYNLYNDIERDGKLGVKQWYNNAHSYVKPHGDNLYNSLSKGTVGSYSYVIHNKPFSTYTDNVSINNYNAYEYMYNYKVGENNTVSFSFRTTSVTGVNNNVKYIEFAKLSDYYIVEKKTVSGKNSTYYPYNQHNYFPKEYVDKLKENLNDYMAGSNASSYYFYISEPVAWKYPGSEMIAGGEKQRSVYVGKDNTKTRNVGLLKAKDVANIDKSAINSVGYYGLYTDQINHTYKNLADLFGISRNWLVAG